MKNKNEDKCYALVLFTYDYYEWKEVHSVSFSFDKLKAEYVKVADIYGCKPLVFSDEHETYQDRKDAHWVIKQIEFLK